MLKIRIIMAILSVVGIIGLVAGTRAYWISQGEARCASAVAVATQKKVLDNDEKLRPIRSYRPSIERMANRLHSHNF